MRSLLAALVLALAFGCKQQPATPKPPPASPEPMILSGSDQNFTMAAPPAGNPADVFVEVDGAKLTRGEADLEISYRMEEVASRVPPQQLPRIREQMVRMVVDQFVARTLLWGEAERRKLTLTKEEEEDGYTKAKAQLPPGMTLEDVMKKSPVGEAKMREDFTKALKINKLIGPILTNEAPVTDEELSTVCDNVRHARHILIKMNREDDAAAKAEKQKKIEEIRTQLVAGGDFADLAGKHSDCPSKQRGGDLGVFPRGQMEPIFEKAAFSQKPGDMGPVVETRFGFHIIQVVEIDKDTKDKLRTRLVRDKKEKAVGVLIADLKSKAQIKYNPEVAPPAVPIQPPGQPFAPAVLPSAPRAVPPQAAP